MLKRKIDVIDSYVVAGDEKGRDGSKFHTFPILTKCSDGSFLCATLVGSEKTGTDGRTKVFRSTDGCKTWTPSVSPTLEDEKDPRHGYSVCGITEIKPNCLIAVYLRIDRFNHAEPLFHPTTDGMQRSDTRIAKSYDNGTIWTKPRTLDYTHPDLIVPSQILVLRDGTVALPCEIWHEWDKGFRQGPSSRFILSHNEGETFPEASVMAKDDNNESVFGDPRLTVLPDSRIVTLFWRYSLKTGADMPVHRAESADTGRTWSPAVSTGITGQIASPLSLDKGLMLCVYQERFGNPGLKAILSYDEGLTYDADTLTAIYRTDVRIDDKNPFSGIQKYSFGYSTTMKLNATEALVPFWCNNGKTTYIRILKVRIS